MEALESRAPQKPFRTGAAACDAVDGERQRGKVEIVKTSRRFQGRLLAAAVVSLALIGAFATPAVAAPAVEVNAVATADGVPDGAVVVQATLDCDKFKGAVAKYAIDHGYCPAPSKGGVTPQTVQTYNCGSSWIYAYNKGYRGKLWVSYGFSSTNGSVVYRNLTIGTSSGIGWGDAAWMASTSYNTERFVGNFNVGSWQSASMSGSIVLVWGGTCSIPTITASTVV